MNTLIAFSIGLLAGVLPMLAAEFFALSTGMTVVAYVATFAIGCWLAVKVWKR